MTTDPLDLILVSPGMAHDGNTLRQRSIGGSETAAICVARALAALGHSVTVFSPCAQPVVADGVQYLPIQLAQSYLCTTPHDVCVISRDLGAASLPTASAVKVLWCHDLALKRARPQFASALWNLDAVFVMSRFQLEQYVAMHAMAKDVFVQTRNGIDLTRFRPVPLPLEKRDPWKLVYGSRPERGLDVLVKVMRLAAQRGLKWKLHVSTYDNPIAELAPMYEALFAQCRAVGNIVLRGALTQAEWTRELSSARAMVYPGVQTDFREIYGIAMAEAQACGTPVVAGARGAVPETVHPNAGVLLGDDSTNVNDPAYHEQVLAALGRLEDAETWRAMSAAGHAHARTLSWDGVAAQWEGEFRRLLARRTDEPWRVERHLARTGDHEAAEAV